MAGAIHLGSTLEKKSDVPLRAFWGQWLECPGEAGCLEGMGKGARTGASCLKGRCSSSYMKPRSMEASVFPGWRWTWAGGDSPSVQIPPNPAWSGAHLMNTFQEMPSRTWGGGRPQDPAVRVRKGLLCVCVLRKRDGVWSRELRGCRD